MLGLQVGTPGTDAESMAANPMLDYAQAYVKLEAGTDGAWKLKGNGGTPETQLPVWVPIQPVPNPGAPTIAQALANARAAVSAYNSVPGAPPMQLVAV